MRTITLAAGLALSAVATVASAQYYRPADPYYDRPLPRAAADQECWNPHAGHFEQVRPGEVQNDLDFSRCRMAGYGDRGYDRRDFRQWRGRQECWNPRAGHFEEVRPNEVQNDLDYQRCRIER